MNIEENNNKFKVIAGVLALNLERKKQEEIGIEMKKTELMTPIKSPSIYYVYKIKNLSDCSKRFFYCY